jgi:hypothetical protein
MNSIVLFKLGFKVKIVSNPNDIIKTNPIHAALINSFKLILKIRSD